MSKQEMMDYMVRNYGFEDYRTVSFFNIASRRPNAGELAKAFHILTAQPQAEDA